MFKVLNTYKGMLSGDFFTASIDDNTGSIKVRPKKEGLKIERVNPEHFKNHLHNNSFEIVSFWHDNHPSINRVDLISDALASLDEESIKNYPCLIKFNEALLAYRDVFNNGGGNCDIDIEKLFGLRFFDENRNHLPDEAPSLETWQLVNACDPVLEKFIDNACDEIENSDIQSPAPKNEPVRDIGLIMQDAFLDVLGYNPGHKVDMEHLMQEVVTCNFRDLTEMYDRAIKLTVETTKEPNENYDLFGRLNNLSRAIKAVMFVRFPDGARDWFDGDLH